MSIEVACRCGKVFRVFDARAGQSVVCGVCGSPVAVPLAASAAPAAVPPAPVFPPPAPAGAMRACPACAESIPAAADVCPICKELLRDRPDPAHARARVQARIAAIDEYLAGPNGVAQDNALTAKGFFPRTWVAVAMTVVSVAAFVIGIATCGTGGDGAVFLIVMGVLFGLPAGIGLLVSALHDRATARIHDSRDALQAFRRYFLAIRSRRTNRAFAALAPAARCVGPVPAVRFAKIPMREGNWHIDDLASYHEYWQNLLRGPSIFVRRDIGNPRSEATLTG